MKKRLKIIRILKNINQSHLSEALSCSVASVSFKESGKRSIDTEEIKIIAAALDVPPEIFFYDEPGFIGYLYGSFDPAEVDRVLEQVMQGEKAAV